MQSNIIVYVLQLGACNSLPKQQTLDYYQIQGICRKNTSFAKMKIFLYNMVENTKGGGENTG